jgi:hypothetical protein
LVQFARLHLGLHGKSGHLPNPLEKGSMTDDPGTQVRFLIDKDGKPKGLHSVTSVDHKELENGKHSISVHIDKSNEHQIIEIVGKILSRAGLPPVTKEDIAAATTEHVIPEPSVTVSATIDLISYQRAILKIIYELAWYWLGDAILDDLDCKNIRACMLDQDLTAEYGLKYSINGTIGFVTPESPFKFIDDDKLHIGFITEESGCICVYVRILNLLEGMIVVSHSADQYENLKPMLLSINSVTGDKIEDELLIAIAKLTGIDEQ